MSQSVFIDGAAGTTGLEIVDRLKGRDEFSLIILSDDDRKDAAKRREALNEADFAILCLPDEAARDAVAMIDPASKVRVIDASSAHRVADGWTYGFPELIGPEKIAEAKFVSNPGCYPTGFLALMAPLTTEQECVRSPFDPTPVPGPRSILPADWPYTVNAVSGYSGGGKALIQRFQEHPEIAFRAYGLALHHKHLAEMQQYAGLKYAPVFSPSVVPSHRGMLVDVPISLEGLGLEHPLALHAELDFWFEEFDETVTVHPYGETPSELLLDAESKGWDGLEIFVCADEQELKENKAKQVRLIARLDNLGKGASGAAIQNLNLMAGLPETTGLRL